jgi:hypothetical protein
MSEVIYMPTQDGRTQPAPYVLTEDEVIRLYRLESNDPERSLQRLRQKGWLKPTQVGKQLRYLLPDVLRALANIQEDNPK